MQTRGGAIVNKKSINVYCQLNGFLVHWKPPFSKNKVKRNLSNDDCKQDIFEAIVKDTYLSDEEFDILISTLNTGKEPKIVKQRQTTS